MANSSVKKYLILGVLFLLPVTFLLFLYPSTHNYTALEIIDQTIQDLPDNTHQVQLKDHITVLGFFGKQPLDKVIAASNLKELVYDKFKGFKKFQIVILVPNNVKKDVDALAQEIRNGDEFKYWKFVYLEDIEIQEVFSSLKIPLALDHNLASDYVYVIDKDLAQRGRIDDREDNEKEKNKPIYGLSAYNCIEVAEIKNKMSDDLRILFTEYRQKRKGNFDSSSRRASDIKDETSN